MLALDLDPLNLRLKSVAGLTDPLAQTLSRLPFEAKILHAGEVLYSPDARELPCYILLRGTATRFKMRSDSSRAIVAFELPGDIVNLESLLLGRTDCGVTVAAAGEVAVVDRAAMFTALQSTPGLESALWRYAFVRAAALEEWLLNIGKRSPAGRVSHLLMEIHARLIAAGASAADASKIHVTMQDIADAMGLQEVVATRIVHELSAGGVIRRDGELVVIEDAGRLAKVGEFRADYLHMAT